MHIFDHAGFSVPKSHVVHGPTVHTISGPYAHFVSVWLISFSSVSREGKVTVNTV